VKTKADVIEDLRSIVATFEDREYSGEFSEGTLFFADLGFVSIDAVLMGEKLETYYERSLPFPAFLGQLAERGVSDIKVGELAEFLCEYLNAPQV
jgi:hypothetical protein